MKDFAEFLKIPFYRFFVDFPLGIVGIFVTYLFIDYHNNTSLTDLENFLCKYNLQTTLEEIPTFIYIGFLVIIVFVGELIASVGEFYVGLFFRGYPRINEKNTFYIIEDVTPKFGLWYVWAVICASVIPFLCSPILGIFVLALVLLVYSYYFLLFSKNNDDNSTVLSAKDFVKAFAKDNTVLQLSEVSFVLSRLFSGFYIIIIFTAPYFLKINEGYIIFIPLAIITLCLAIYSRSFGNALLKEQASMMSTYIY